MNNNSESRINLIINHSTIFTPGDYEWPHMEINGKDSELMPFVVLSIIPSVNWYAVFADENCVYKKPLACFALILDDDRSQYVSGLCDRNGAIYESEHEDNFLGHEGPGENLDWQEKWEDWYDRRSKEFKDISEYRIDPNNN